MSATWNHAMQALADRERLVEARLVRRPGHDAIIHDQKRMSPTISEGAAKTGIRVTPLSPTSDPHPSWALAVFAHNEAGRIRPALESVVRAAAGQAVEVFVLANGCTDRTSAEVRACADIVAGL